MRLLTKAALFAASAAIAPGLAGPAGASALAQSDSIYTVGQGVLVPGIPAVGCQFQTTITFNSEFLVITGADQAVSGSFSFEGRSSICESQDSGAGSGTVSGNLAGSVNYVRKGNVVTVTAPGGLSVNGSTRTIPAVSCEFLPTSLNPTSSYMLVCVPAAST